MFRFAILTIVLLGAMVAALTVGRYPLHLADISEFAKALAGFTAMPPSRYELLRNIIVDIRLPRILAAALVGSALASSGAGFQAIFRNPLVSPGILGVLGGAGFGAAIGILWSGNWAVVQSCAFAMGLAAVGISLTVANLFGQASIVMLVLGGMVSGSLFTAALSIVKYTADPYDQLPAIVYWLLGSLGAVSLEQIYWAGIPMIAGVTVLSIYGRALDPLTMGDDEARSLGLPAQAIRYAVVAAATLVSALSVSMAGMIGWVGLVVPHFARIVLGPRNVVLVPASAFLGAIFLIVADMLTRTMSSTEIPIGIVTELLGIPAFIVVLRHTRRGWS